MALIGEVHTALLLEFAKNGLPAVGMFGCIQAAKKAGPWGLVGTELRADSQALTALLDAAKLIGVIEKVALGHPHVENEPDDAGHFSLKSRNDSGFLSFRLGLQLGLEQLALLLNGSDSFVNRIEG